MGPGDTGHKALCPVSQNIKPYELIALIRLVSLQGVRRWQGWTSDRGTHRCCDYRGCLQPNCNGSNVSDDLIPSPIPMQHYTIEMRLLGSKQGPEAAPFVKSPYSVIATRNAVGRIILRPALHRVLRCM